MKNKILSLLLACAAVLGLTACNDDNWEPKLDKEGTLRLATMSVDVSTAETLMSRAGDIDVNTFTVTISQAGEAVHAWAYADMPEIITLPVGKYSIEVKSHEVQKQDWDKPYFLGTANFEIENKAVTEIGTITCKFASVKVTVKYADDIKKHMGDDCKVTVVANDEGRLEFSAAETRAGFFEAVAESMTLVATFTGSIDGNPVKIEKTYANVAPGMHYQITYSAKENIPDMPDEVGAVSQSGISVNTSVLDINQGANITLEEDVINNPGERPGKEEPLVPDTPVDPGNENAITFTPEGISLESENPVDVENAIVKITAEAGFAQLQVDITSDSEAFISSAGEMLPLSFDLANPATPDLAGKLSNDLGLPVGPFPATQQKVNFDVTNLVPLLAAFPGHHVFDLKVVDNDGNTKSIKLKFYAE